MNQIVSKAKQFKTEVWHKSKQFILHTDVSYLSSDTIINKCNRKKKKWKKVLGWDYLKMWDFLVLSLVIQSWTNATEKKEREESFRMRLLKDERFPGPLSFDFVVWSNIRVFSKPNTKTVVMIIQKHFLLLDNSV